MPSSSILAGECIRRLALCGFLCRLGRVMERILGMVLRVSTYSVVWFDMKHGSVARILGVKRRSSVLSVIKYSLKYHHHHHHHHRGCCFHHRAWHQEQLHLALLLHQNVPPPLRVLMATSHHPRATRSTSTTLPFPQLSPSPFFLASLQSYTSSLRYSIERTSAG